MSPTKPAQETTRGPARGAPRRGFGRIRRERSGRYSAAYVGPDLQLHRAPMTFDARLDAEGWLHAEHHRIEQGEWVSPVALREARAEAERLEQLSRVGVREYAERWLAGRELRPGTVADYNRLLRRHLYPTLADVPVRNLTRADVKVWFAGLNPQTPRLRAKAYALLRSIMNGAVDDELISVNPVQIRNAGASRRVKKIEPASLAELSTLTAAMPDRLQLAVLLGAWCAMRYGEIAELRRGDLDLVHGKVRIRRGVTWVDGHPVVGAPKTAAGVRDVSIPPHLLPIIEDHLARHTEPGPDALLFPAARGGQMWAPTFHKSFSKARQAAGRPDLRFHDLRHTGAVLAAATGATLAELMQRLGHTTAGAAMRYQHAARDRDAQIAEALSRIAAGA
jgi:integrase